MSATKNAGSTGGRGGYPAARRPLLRARGVVQPEHRPKVHSGSGDTLPRVCAHSCQVSIQPTASTAASPTARTTMASGRFHMSMFGKGRAARRCGRAARVCRLDPSRPTVTAFRRRRDLTIKRDHARPRSVCEVRQECSGKFPSSDSRSPTRLKAHLRAQTDFSRGDCASTGGRP
jgi:hypothetical protein